MDFSCVTTPRGRVRMPVSIGGTFTRDYRQCLMHHPAILTMPLDFVKSHKLIVDNSLISNYICNMKIDNTFYLIGRIRDNYTSFLEKELRARGLKKIVTSHADIIVALKSRGELTMSEISETINRDRSTITALVSKLEKLGYVRIRRNESDRRSSFSSLTEKGNRLIPEFLSISGNLYRKAVAGISEEEWAGFRRVLEKLHKNLA